MNKTFFFIITLVICLSSTAQDLSKMELIDMNGKQVKQDLLTSNNVFFLVSSLTCGYCLRDMEHYNELATTYSSLTDFTFIVLMESDKEHIEKFKEKRDFLNDKWIVIPSAKAHYTQLWKKRVFPEYLAFKNGELDKSFAFASASTKKKITRYFSKNLKK